MTFDEQAATLDRKSIVGLLASNAQLTTRVQELTRQLDWLKRQMFGRKSETLDPNQRLLFEDAYVDKFGAASIGAIAGYSLIDSAANLSRETVEKAIAGRSIDAVLVTRLAGVEEIKEYQPPSSYEPYRSYHRYYAHAREFSSPGYYVTYKLLTLETNLYDTVTQQLIWSMQSESIESSAPQKVIDGQIDLTVKQLLERGLVVSN